MNKDLATRLATLYQRMEQAYDACAKEAGLSCSGCATNCCTSYFQHHTYSEWLYLWQGVRTLPPQKRLAVLERARAVVAATHKAQTMGLPPQEMCPLNENGLCILYRYRLMICRMHGTRNEVHNPDGTRRLFPGCQRFTQMYPPNAAAEGQGCVIPTLNRTPFYQELAAIELALRQNVRQPLPRVNLTLAEMLANGAPRALQL